MTCISTHLGPFRSLGVTIRPFNKVEQFLQVFLHRRWIVSNLHLEFLACKRKSALLSVSVASRVLTRNARWQYRKRFCTYILAELEVLIEPKSHRLVVVPDVRQLLALPQRSYGIDPSIHVVDSLTVTHASSWEADEFRFHVSQQLSEVGS